MFPIEDSNTSRPRAEEASLPPCFTPFFKIIFTFCKEIYQGDNATSENGSTRQIQTHNGGGTQPQAIQRRHVAIIAVPFPSMATQAQSQIT